MSFIRDSMTKTPKQNLEREASRNSGSATGEDDDKGTPEVKHQRKRKPKPSSNRQEHQTEGESSSNIGGHRLFESDDAIRFLTSGLPGGGNFISKDATTYKTSFPSHATSNRLLLPLSSQYDQVRNHLSPPGLAVSRPSSQTRNASKPAGSVPRTTMKALSQQGPKRIASEASIPSGNEAPAANAAKKRRITPASADGEVGVAGRLPSQKAPRNIGMSVGGSKTKEATQVSNLAHHDSSDKRMLRFLAATKRLEQGTAGSEKANMKSDKEKKQSDQEN